MLKTWINENILTKFLKILKICGCLQKETKRSANIVMKIDNDTCFFFFFFSRKMENYF